MYTIFSQALYYRYIFHYRVRIIRRPIIVVFFAFNSERATVLIINNNDKNLAIYIAPVIRGISMCWHCKNQIIIIAPTASMKPKTMAMTPPLLSIFMKIKTSSSTRCFRLQQSHVRVGPTDMRNSRI